MNIFDFVRADGGGSLMPVVIFIIWIIISVVGNSKAKKKKQQLAEKRRIEEEKRRQQAGQEYAPYEKPSEPEIPVAQEPDFGSSTDSGPLEQDLESIFTSSEPAETYDGQVDEKAEAAPIEPFAYDNQPVPSVPVVETAMAGAPHPDTFSSFGSEPLLLSEPEFSTPSVDFASLNEARKGVVWSEILAPCKALRDE